MRNLIKRAAIVAGAAVVLLGPAVGVASASAAAPALSWSQGGTTITSYGFGTVDGVGGQTASQTFTLTNTGGRASGTITVGLTGSSAFTITSDGCTGTSLGPSKSCNVTAKYAPTASGEADSATLAATGEHASASLALTGKSGTPDLTLSPGSLLGTTSGGTKNYDYANSFALGSWSTTFTVTNGGTGTAPVVYTLGGDPNFGLSNSTCGTYSATASLAPNGTCTFDLTFTAPAGCSSGDEFHTPLLVEVQENGDPYIVLVAHGFCP